VNRVLQNIAGEVAARTPFPIKVNAEETMEVYLCSPGKKAMVYLVEGPLAFDTLILAHSIVSWREANK
jgi:hypothetical protein